MGNVAVAVSWSGYFCELLKGLGIDHPAPGCATDLRDGDAARRAFLRTRPPHRRDSDRVQPAGRPDRRARDVGARDRRQGVVAVQRHHGRAEGLHPDLLHRRRAPSTSSRPTGIPFAPNGLGRNRLRGGPHLLRVHRFRRRVAPRPRSAKNPQRDMPIGILGSLAICSVLYMATALVLTGIVPLSQIQGSSEPLAKAFSLLGMNWAAGSRRVRRGDRDDGGTARLPVRPAAHLLLDGARRAAPDSFAPHPSRSTARRTSRRSGPGSSSRRWRPSRTWTSSSS